MLQLTAVLADVLPTPLDAVRPADLRKFKDDEPKLPSCRS